MARSLASQCKREETAAAPAVADERATTKTSAIDAPIPHLPGRQSLEAAKGVARDPERGRLQIIAREIGLRLSQAYEIPIHEDPCFDPELEDPDWDEGERVILIDQETPAPDPELTPPRGFKLPTPFSTKETEPPDAATSSRRHICRLTKIKRQGANLPAMEDQHED